MSLENPKNLSDNDYWTDLLNNQSIGKKPFYIR